MDADAVLAVAVNVSGDPALTVPSTAVPKSAPPTKPGAVTGVVVVAAGELVVVVAAAAPLPVVVVVAERNDNVAAVDSGPATCWLTAST